MSAKKMHQKSLDEKTSDPLKKVLKVGENAEEKLEDGADQWCKM